MNRNCKRILDVVALLVVVLSIPDIGYAKEMTVEFGDTRSVTVTNARVKDTTGNELTLTGELSRPHRVLLAGHLHAYTYMKDGEMVSDSKHRVSGLNSKKRGIMRVPFRISISKSSNAINRVYLEYHAPGHPEI